MSKLTPSLVTHAVLGILFALLLCASWVDAKSNRIPNKLVLVGCVLGVLLNAALREGLGFVSCWPGGIGIWKSIAGLLLGATLLLPMYLLRAMGAGDVKLMAMVGAFIGPISIIGVILMTFIVGGFMSIITVIQNKTVKRLFTNLQSMVLTGFIQGTMREVPNLQTPEISAGRMPYAIAITGGALVYFALLGNDRLTYLYSLNFF